MHQSLIVSKYSKYNLMLVIIGIAINVALAFFAYSVGIPLYFDAAGTILVSCLCGTFPGIITAVATNVLCAFFNQYSVYYGLIGVVIAIISAWFMHSQKYKNWINFFVMVFYLALFAGGLGLCFQWFLLGEPQMEIVREQARITSGSQAGPGYFFAAILLNIGLNYIDKAIAFVIALLIFHRIPKAAREGMRNAQWRQKVLSQEEVEAIREEHRGRTLRTRWTVALSLTATSLAAVIIWIALMTSNGSMQEDLQFLFKTLMGFSGFFVLILGSGLWISGYYLVYPISSLSDMAKQFVDDLDNPEKTDQNVRALRKLAIITNDEVEALYKSICDMASATAEQMRSIQYLNNSSSKLQNGLIIAMANMVESRNEGRQAHIQKTTEYVRVILNGLKRRGYYAEKLTKKYMQDVEMSAPLHDVGKIKIPDTLLEKPGRLTEEEATLMRMHTVEGGRILEDAMLNLEGENYLKEARNMAIYHHERWDGKGYPEGLHGQVIPLSARIMAVANEFDGLTTPRTYRPAYKLEKAMEIIKERSGEQFDPKCVEAFEDSLADVKRILKKYQEK